MTIFDGRAVAQEKAKTLQKKVVSLKKKGVTPKLVSIVIGDENGALKYQEMKKKAAESVGIRIDIHSFSETADQRHIIQHILKLNNDFGVHGIMVQLPVPKSFSREKIVNSIDSQKDVDGLKEDSPFSTPVVRAVLESMENASPEPIGNTSPKVAVVGAKGFEGSKLVHELKNMGFDVVPVDKDDDVKNDLQESDVVISCTGVASLIKGEMLKNNVIAIDVGAPNGDFDFESVSEKASFITPVPGGIGPVTITCLLENVVEAAELA